MGCGVDGCDSPYFGLGFCRKHYKRLKRNGDPLKLKRNIHHSYTCKLCDLKYYGKGYCIKHYNKWRIHGDPLFIKSNTCSIEKCDRQFYAKNLCSMHYERLKRHGNPLINKREHPDKCGLIGCDNKFYCKNQCMYHYNLNIQPKFGNLTSHQLRNKKDAWRKLIHNHKKCVNCGSSSNPNAHHIFYKKYYPKLQFNENNGILLCKKCHLETHNFKF